MNDISVLAMGISLKKFIDFVSRQFMGKILLQKII